MRVSRGSLWLVTLLSAAVAPLHAQFSTYGCPSGLNQTSPAPNGFTAGSAPPNSQMCLLGTFQVSVTYDVTVTRTDTNAQVIINGVPPQSSNSILVVTVNPGFYSSITGTAPVPLNISIVSPQVINSGQTGSFQINPPLAAGSPVVVGAVGNLVNWTLFTGGSSPYTVSEGSGSSIPPGMTFPTSGNVFSGVPSQTGQYPFNSQVSDAWGGGQLFSFQTAYVVPVLAISAPNPASAVIGSGATQVTLAGSGFISPQTIQGVPVAGSTVQASFLSTQVTLTPSSYSPNQLTVTIPANLLTQEGYVQLIANNLAVVNSNQETFFVNPTITSLSTSTRTVGTPAFLLTITGAGFGSGAVVLMNTTVLPSNVVNSGVITATVPSVANPGPQLITVLNSDSTATLPATLTFLPQPTVSALSPSSANAGSPSFSLVVSGGQFLSGMTVYFNSIPLATNLVTNQKLSANVPAGAVASAGIVPVTVVTSDGYSTPYLLFTINANGPPPLQLLTFSPLTPGVVNTPYSFTFTASAGAGGYTYAVTGGTPPAGLQLSAAGVLSGTPTTIGSSQFTVQLTDSAGATVSRTFTLNIAPAPLSLTTGPLANITVNTPISIQFAGAGGVPPYTFVEFGALPPGTQITGAGLLSGTPTKSGSYPFQLFLNDSAGASASKNYTLNVGLPGVVIVQPSPLPPGQLYVNYSTTLTATGGVGAPYTWAATGLPQGLNIANNSGLIDGLPTAVGTFTVTVTAKDLNGTTATQTYVLVISSPILTITTPSLVNGAVGSSYSGVLTATGGSGTYTYAATGLPPGLAISSTGVFSGTPTTAGAYSIAATVTDATGATAKATFRITIVAKLVVTAVTIPNGVQGVAITPVNLTATGGTAPYQWQSATLPPGLTLASNGTLSGTPTAAGNYTFTVYVVDNDGSLSSGTEQLTVALPAPPPVTITGLPPSTAPGQQQSLQVTIGSPYPAPITANLTLTFKPVSGADDPNIQFSTGGHTAQVVIPAGSTTSATSVGVQTGTVAGTITITSQLVVGTTNGTAGPTQTITVQPSAPVITNVTATRTSTGFTVTVTGFASNRDVDSASYQFSASEGANLQTTTLNTTVTPLFTTWYGSSSSSPYGSQFTLTQPFTVNGANTSILSVTVTLTNALGLLQGQQRRSCTEVLVR